jgi:hypothetical protein
MRNILVVIDIDLVLLNCDEREKYANETVAMWTKKFRHILEKKDPKLLDQLEKSLFYDEETFYSPSLAAKDTLIEGVREDVLTFAAAGFTIRYMSSRPWALYETTKESLKKFNLPDAPLLCKRGSWQYVRTADVWKPGIVHTLIHELKPTSVVVIDDEKKILEAIVKQNEDLDVPIYVYETTRAAAEFLK